MAYKINLTKIEFDASSEEQKKLYIENGEGYKLDVDDVEVAAEMRRAKEREKARADLAEKEAKDAKDALAAIQGDNARRNGDIASIEKGWKDKVDDAIATGTAKEQKLKSHLFNILVKDAARAIATKISTAPSIILPHIEARLVADLDGDTPVCRVKGSDGKASAITLEELEKSFIDNKDFAAIIIGSKASGSGGGADNGGGASKKPSEYSEKERVELFTSNRAEYDRIFPVA